MKFDDEPDYARWREGFESLVTSDEAGMIVGRSLKDSPDSESSLALLRSEPPVSRSGWETPLDDDFFPLTTVPIARVPTTRDLIGDEKVIVRRRLARIEKMPQMDPMVAGDEFILTWEQEDHDEEMVGRKYLQEIDEFWVE